MLSAEDGAILQKFDYRYPRYTVDLPVELTVGDATVSARCTEISEPGMKLELPQPVVAGSCGSVSLTFEKRLHAFKVRVAHAEKMDAGVVFLYASDEERTAVSQLVASLSLTKARPGPVLLKKN